MTQLDTRLCPFCNGEIKTAAKLCKHCKQPVPAPVSTSRDLLDGNHSNTDATSSGSQELPEPVHTMANAGLRAKIRPRKLFIVIGILLLVVIAAVLYLVMGNTASSYITLTYFPENQLISAMSSCTTYPCTVSIDGGNWTIKKGKLEKGREYPVPMRASTYQKKLEGPLIRLSSGASGEIELDEFVHNGGWRVGVPADMPFVTFLSEDGVVPCPDMAKCVTTGLIWNGQLITTDYSICYEPKNVKLGTSTTLQSTFVSENVIMGARKYQVGRLPRLEKEVVIPVKHHWGSDARFLALTNASYDNEKLFAVGGHVTFYQGVRGCVNVYYVKRIPVTERLFKIYDSELGAVNQQDKNWDKLTVPE